MDKYDVFISFSNSDVEEVSEIVEIVKSQNVSCWFQTDNTKGDFIKEINGAIKNSSAFVVFLSPQSADSLMVKNEINRAISQRKRNADYDILPVVIEPLEEDQAEEMTLLLGSFNWLSRADYKNQYELVLKILKQLNLIKTQNGMQSIYTGDEEIEVMRLNVQNEFLNKYANVYLDEIFAKYNNPTVLDVGCSSGENIKRRLNNRKYKKLLGIDKNEDKIRQAKENLENEKDSFMVCDIAGDDLDSLLSDYLADNKLKGFDVIHLSAVLLHLEKPDALLKQLHGYLADGGTIFIQDEDDGVNLVSPSSPYFDECFYVWEHSLEAGDRKMGRKIPFYLRDAE